MTLTENEIAVWKTRIDAMSQVDMASLRRFAPAGHPVFDRHNGDLSEYFEKSFKSKGGMTPDISKRLGW